MATIEQPTRPRRRVAPHPTTEERTAAGRAARKAVPRSSHARLGAAPRIAATRSSMLEEQAATRVPELVPIRYGRMLVSPFTFYRGAAVPDGRRSRRDPAHRPRRAALRRRAPLQLRRLRRARPAARVQHQRLRRDAAGPVRVGRQAARGELRGGRAATAASATPQRAAINRDGGRGRTARRCTAFAGMRTLDIWYARLDVDEIVRPLPRGREPQGADALRGATSPRRAARTACKAFAKLTDDRRRRACGSSATRRSSCRSRTWPASAERARDDGAREIAARTTAAR